MGPGNEGPFRPPGPWGGKRKEGADQEAELERLPEILAPNSNGGGVFHSTKQCSRHQLGVLQFN